MKFFGMSSSKTIFNHYLQDNLPFLGKPTAETNPAFGILSFASLDLLETRDYVRDDVIFLRVCVKKKNFGKN